MRIKPKHVYMNKHPNSELHEVLSDLREIISTVENKPTHCREIDQSPSY